MKSQAAYGQVLVNDLPYRGEVRLSREEAVRLIQELAEAVQHSGDISDPRSVLLAMTVSQAVEDWLKE
jgi:hypothetical protein